MRVRDASVDDVPSITAIYNELISSRTVTWTDHEDSVDDRARWLARRQAAG
ncbi:MAG: GNAT family N-acetyltransferase, partial [Actinobacteria bacterium]|nr:GNAT family N-acetyltransferase [Actinomycetota bacterium]